MDLNNKVLKDRLIQLRKNNDLTQQEFSDQIKVNRTTYAHYETGRRQPDNDLLITMANFYGVTVDYLLGRTDDPNIFIREGEDLPEELRNVGVKYIKLAKTMEDKEIPPEDVEKLIKILEYQKQLEKENKKE